MQSEEIVLYCFFLPSHQLPICMGNCADNGAFRESVLISDVDVEHIPNTESQLISLVKEHE